MGKVGSMGSMIAGAVDDVNRLVKVETEEKAALTENEKLYGGMVNEADSYYQAQIDASKEWADKQTELQNAQTDFAIQEINQQKEQAKKDYTKEQSGAYVDWQKQSNEYGANAEAMAAQGLANSGFSESSQVSMYNTYQNRVTAARESYQVAVQNYNNAITEARLQNNAVLAEIAYQALQQQLEISLAGFQYKNTLVLEQANKKLEIQQMYHNQYQDVLDDIYREKTLAEQIRQHNENLAEEKRQYNESLALQREQFAWQKAQASKSSSGGSSGGSGGSKGSINKTSSSSSKGGSSSISSSNKTSSSNKSSSKNSGPTVDMNSVLALGYGPISASRLNQLIKEGKVEEYEVDGKLKYVKVFNY